MSPKNRTRLVLEALEARAVPAVTYNLDGSGNLNITGQTTNPTFRITSDALGVTVMDGASTQSFVVTGNLTVNLQMTNASPRFDYTPGVDSSGSVSLTVSSFSPLEMCAAGSVAGVNVLGPLSITTGAANDNIDVSNLDIHGNLSVNSGAGYDTVILADNTLTTVPACPVGPVTVEGNLTIQNGNLIGLGAIAGLGATPPVLIQGIANLSTDNAPGLTGLMRNNIDIEPQVTIQGSLIATLNGAFELFSTQGVQQSSVVVQFGAGQILSSFMPNQQTFGDVTVTAPAGASFNNAIAFPNVGGMDFNGLIGGNLKIVTGNGRNDVAINAAIFGRSVSYFGGAGVDNVNWGTTASAPGAALSISLNAGNDSMKVSNSNWLSAVFDGGFGTDIFTATVPLSHLTIKNFE